MSKNVYEMVTNRILEQLSNGCVPWNRPWSGTFNQAYNRISKKPYSLLNQMLLKYPDEYMTFKQATDLGGKVKKGAKAEFVVFFKMHEYTTKNEDGEEVKKTIPLLNYYRVFNIRDIEGIEPLDRPTREHEPIAEAEQVKNDYISREGLRIEECITDEAYYSPSRDLVHVPCREQYERIEAYYSTLYHELIHSTGNIKRLARIDNTANSHFGSESYSKEELTAELGSAMFLNMLGIETAHSFKNSSAYIQNWLQVLRNDSHFVISASVRAEKAIEYILHGKQTPDT